MSLAFASQERFDCRTREMIDLALLVEQSAYAIRQVTSGMEERVRHETWSDMKGS